MRSKLLHLSRSSVRLVVTEGFSKKINVLNQGREEMNMDFKDLEVFAEQDFGLMLAEIPAERTSQYQDAIPEEVLDLLEEAVETYDIVEPTLPQRLRKIARKEIDFLISLYHDKIKQAPSLQNSQTPQKILQRLFCNLS